ncbi:hypothetical protein KEJ15_08325 [Candidatus Bathyarchaeota archaeon]|nr:hypothetical protein [Candidatus Bathyarchaeota archaeon]
MPSKTGTDIRRLVRNAQSNTLLSKILMSLFIVMFAFMILFSTTYRETGVISLSLSIVGDVSVFLAILLFLLIVMGLQVTTSFFASDVIVSLNALPLASKDISFISLLCFARIFDLPLLVAIISFPLAYLLFTGSVAGSLVVVLGIFVTEVFALALTTALAKFFYSRIAGATGGSAWKTLLRMALMLVWVIPIFGVYIVTSFWMEIANFFMSLTQPALSTSYAILAVYPFSYGYLASQVTVTEGMDFVSQVIAAASSICYFALAIGALTWTGKTIRSIGSVGAISSGRSVVKDTEISPQGRLAGIIRKDLRVASRSPSYASFLLLPAFQTAVLAFSFSTFRNVGFGETLGMLMGMSAIAILLPPMLFSIEGLSSAYARSLPLTKKTLILAKATLATVTYVISLIVLVACTLYLQKSIFFILAYGGIHILSVTAATMVESLLLVTMFWKSGFAIGNIYTRLTTYVLILIPGAIVVFAPVLGAILLAIFVSDLDFVLLWFATAALLMFIVAAFLVGKIEENKLDRRTITTIRNLKNQGLLNSN